MIAEIITFLKSISGNTLIFSLIVMALLFFILILSKTPLNQILIFLTIPVYALSKLGYFGGIVSASILPLFLIFCGWQLAVSLKKMING